MLRVAHESLSANEMFGSKMGGRTMFKWAVISLIISGIAGLLGFRGIAEPAAEIARFLFWTFMIITVLLLAIGFFGRRRQSE